MRKFMSRTIAFFTAVLMSISAVSINIFAENEDDYPEDTMMDDISDADFSDVDENNNDEDISDESIDQIQEGVIGSNERTKVKVPATLIRQCLYKNHCKHLCCKQLFFHLRFLK